MAETAYHYKTLEDTPLQTLADCLNLAFADYELPLHLDEKALAGYLAASGVEFGLSFGAFSGGALVGFILNSCGLYQGRRLVFDAGTGVVPDHRGRGVFTGLYAFGEQILRQKGIGAYYLEVLQKNDRAIAAYQKQGFAVTREYVVLHAEGEWGPEPTGVSYTPYGEFDFGRAEGCRRAEPCYEHADDLLGRNPGRCQVASTGAGETEAFCVFDRTNGQILQLGCRTPQDLDPILKALLARYGSLTAKNIDAREGEILGLLGSLGFKEITRQFEMAKPLNH